MTEADARKIVRAFIDTLERYSQGGLEIVDSATIEKPYGWIYFYNSRRFLETRDMIHGIAGNGPLVVLAASGEVVTLGTARRSEDAIREFERARDL